MTYIGQQPATTFDAGIQDRFTGLTTNTVTLNHEISAEEDILVVWNNIVQDKNTYSVGGTGNKTVTLGGTLVSADVVTVYYLNKVMQSVNPTAGSVGITELNVSDGSNGQALTTNGSGTLSFASTGTNTPAFQANAGSTDQSIAHNTWTKLNLGTEDFDTDSAFGSNKFTVPSNEGGKYVFGYGTSINNLDDTEKLQIALYKNGSVESSTQNRTFASKDNNLVYIQGTQILVLSATDYIELYMAHEEGGSQDTNSAYVFLYGYKLIGV